MINYKPSEVLLHSRMSHKNNTKVFKSIGLYAGLNKLPNDLQPLYSLTRYIFMLTQDHDGGFLKQPEMQRRKCVATKQTDQSQLLWSALPQRVITFLQWCSTQKYELAFRWRLILTGSTISRSSKETKLLLMYLKKKRKKKRQTQN